MKATKLTILGVGTKLEPKSVMVEGELDSIGSAIVTHFALGVTSILPPDLDYLETDVAHCVAIECFCEVTTMSRVHLLDSLIPIHHHFSAAL
jgi:hypothetical protein